MQARGREGKEEEPDVRRGRRGKNQGMVFPQHIMMSIIFRLVLLLRRECIQRKRKVGGNFLTTVTSNARWLAFSSAFFPRPPSLEFGECNCVLLRLVLRPQAHGLSCSTTQDA